MKALNNSIIKYIISAICFVILSIILTICITYKIISNGFNDVYILGNLMVDINPNISKKLEKLSDIDGINTNANNITITNNDTVTKKYQIILKPFNEFEKDIRINIDNKIIRNLDKFVKNNDGYIIYEEMLVPEYSSIHKIRVWQDKESTAESIKVNFKIEINVLDE